MRKQVISVILAGVLSLGVLSGCGSSEDTGSNKAIFDDVELLKTTVGEVEDILEYKNLNYQNGNTSVMDSFLGFDCRYDYRSIRPLDLAEDSECSEKDEVISSLGVNIYFHNDDEIKNANEILKKYFEGKMLKEYAEPLVREPIEDGDTPVTYYPIESKNIEGEESYYIISWYKTYSNVDDFGGEYVDTVYECRMWYSSKEDLMHEVNETGTEAKETSTEEALSPWQSAYIDYLKQYESGCYDSQNLRFDIAYVDNDDVPELILFQDNSHERGVVAVLTYYNNAVVETGCYGENGRAEYLEKQNLIHSFYHGGGGSFDSLVSIQDGLGILVFDISSYEDIVNGASQYTYTFGDEEVTKEIYDAKFSELSQYVFKELEYDNGYTFSDENFSNVIR